jgi:hypothetical protein
MVEERSDEAGVGFNDWLGRTCATATTERRLVQEFPSIGAI